MSDNGDFDATDAPSFYTAWCTTNNCTHGHCPRGCEHPQPGRYAGDERLLCGGCWFFDREAVLIVPCDPATCRDDIDA